MKTFLAKLVDNDMLDIQQLTMDVMSEDNDNYRKMQTLSSIMQTPFLEPKEIKKEIDSLQFPIVFLDYEGIAKAIPPFEGTSSWEQIPFQFAAEILEQDGTLNATGYVGRCLNKSMLDDLMSTLLVELEGSGSIVVWNSTYESNIHNNLMKFYPEHQEFLAGLNDRIYDLEKIFSSKCFYVDSNTRGKSSLKYVLPAIQGENPYENLDIQDGGQAVVEWSRMIDKELPKEERDLISKNLFEYCYLDAHAMYIVRDFLIYCITEENKDFEQE